MPPTARFALKNRMLFYNLFTNLIGVWIVLLLSFRSISPPFYEIADLAHRINLACIPILLAATAIVQLLYEGPIRHHLDVRRGGASPAHHLEEKARRRLLNAPFFITAIDLAAWMAGAVLYAALYAALSGSDLAPRRVFFQNALVGLIASTASFFVIEQVLQKSLIPRFFPRGGLYQMPGAARIRIRTRLIALFFAVNLIPFFSFLVLIQGTYGTRLPAARLLDHVRSSVVTNSLIAAAVGICVTGLVSTNLSRPLNHIIGKLKRIREGDLTGSVTVTTNDEIGYAGDVINEMTTGLKERERMKHSLELAKEVQLKLLPEAAPATTGLDIAGVSLYCDETGGDYFDYLTLHGDEGDRLGIVVGDVSDHGVHAALLMATARAFLRLRASQPGSLAAVVADVNRQLAADIAEGGQFMTLFLVAIAVQNGTVEWVRAGHDPVLWYDPARDRMRILKGPGIPLGIDGHFDYQLNRKEGLAKGHVIVLGTDGIWEARNRTGAIYGRERFGNVIRRHAAGDAAAIVRAVVADVEAFQEGAKIEDDITLVVIKISAEG